MDEDDQFELDVPVFIELKQSKYATNDLGVFCTMPLSSDQHLGSFKGKQRKLMSHCADPNYVWTILSSRQIPLFYVDASDPKDSNWLRFIRSTNDASKYNTYCMQQNQEINYFTFKEVKLGDELLTYLPGKKKKNKAKNFVHKSYKLAEEITEKAPEKQYESVNSPPTAQIKQDLLSVTKSTIEKPKEEEEEEIIVSSPKQIEIDIILKEKLEVTRESPCKFALIDLIIENDETHQREIEKCILCPFSTVQTIKNQNILSEHFHNTHIADIKETNNVISDLMNSMLNKICNESVKQNFQFKCHICQNNKTFTTKSLLSDHLNLIHSELSIFESIKCFFCSQTFKVTNYEDLLEHVKINHKTETIETKLVVPRAEGSYDNFNLNYFLMNELEDEEEASNQEGSVTSEKIIVSSEMIDDDSQSTKSSLPSSVTNESSNKSSSSNEKATKKNEQSNSTNLDSKGNEPESTSKRTQSPNQAPAQTKTYTCQLCKKQFEQRHELSKHQCIELNLKLLKKKKDMRKKKWREAHWKRKIDLSYIETTSLTSLSQNIADNLSFCIDGTSEDLKAYSKEVKDYLSTELGNETQNQMTLKSLNLYEKIVPKQLQNPHHNTNLTNNNQLIDMQIQKKSDSYFVDTIYNESASIGNQAGSGTKSRAVQTNASITSQNQVYQCKSCRAKRTKLNDLIQHQRDSHCADLKTSFDFYSKFNHNLTSIAEEKNNQINLSNNLYGTSPIGFMSTDPTAYIINYHWEQTLPKQCDKCGLVLNRAKYRKHILTCTISDESMDTDMNETIRTADDCKIEDETEVSIDENKEIEANIKNESIQLNDVDEICNQVVNNLLTKVENIQEDLILIRQRNKRPATSIDMNSTNTKKKITDKSFDSSKSPDKRNQRSPVKGKFDESEAEKQRISSRTRSSRKSDDKLLIEPNLNSPIKIESPTKKDTDEPKILQKDQSLVTVSTQNNRKIHTCTKCSLEFTSANSVFRHQEKSCLRVRVINIKPVNIQNKETMLTKKKCPICGSNFYNTHKVSIHIYKHHRNLLGSALKEPVPEAKRLHDIQLKKVDTNLLNETLETDEGPDEMDEDTDTDELYSKLNLTVATTQKAPLTKEEEEHNNNRSNLNTTL